MSDPFDCLLTVLREPDASVALSLAEWDRTIRLARSANLLASLHGRLESAGVLDRIPDPPRLQLDSAKIVAAKHVRDVKWEIRRIRAALKPLGLPVLLLKGAAYVAAELPSARGRIFGDIDFMVPKERIREVEGALQVEGWLSPTVDPYDDKYYRDWSHQIPPMFHATRNSIIDVHFSIIPDIARETVNAAKVYDASIPAQGDDAVRVLAPADMVLHSAVHLFNEGEFDHGLRDVVDLDGLMRDFGRDTSFWQTLTDRAEDLGLTRPLYHALHNTARMLATPVPSATMQRARRWRRPGPWGDMLDFLFSRALRPDHELCRRRIDAFARQMLYIRGHYIRLPFHLLIPHLARKAVVKRFPQLIQQPRF